jgi:hypothetical protein
VRSPCAFSVDEKLLAVIDRRAKSLGMNRSNYIVQCIRRDLADQTAPLQIVADAPAPVFELRQKAAVYEKPKRKIKTGPKA